MMHNRIVTRDEWLAARKAHLAREKELTGRGGQLSAERRDLSWGKIEEPYVVDGLAGRETLADLFDGRSQLIIKHFMLGPGWQEGCVGCSFHADHIDGALMHLVHHDVTLLAVSRAPLAEIEAFKNRMGWRFKCVSSHGSGFNHDFHVSFTPEQNAQSRTYYNYGKRALKSEEKYGST